MWTHHHTLHIPGKGKEVSSRRLKARKKTDALGGLKQSLTVSEPWFLTPENDIIIMAFHGVVTRIK